MVDQIADQDDQPSPLGAFGRLVQYGSHVRFAACFDVVERLKDATELRGMGAWRNVLSDLRVKKQQSNSIVLADQQMRQCGG